MHRARHHVNETDETHERVVGCSCTGKRPVPGELEAMMGGRLEWSKGF